MRSIKELLQILLDNIDLLDENDGLCSLVIVCFSEQYINWKEHILLSSYIESNPPWNLYRMKLNYYYWKPGDKYSRIKWLKKHINKNK